MAELKIVLKETMAGYETVGLNGYTYLTSNEDETKFTVVAVADDDNQPRVFTGLVAHLESDMIIIYHDANNKPLVDALIQNGVPREKIILAYAGETLATAD